MLYPVKRDTRIARAPPGLLGVWVIVTAVETPAATYSIKQPREKAPQHAPELVCDAVTLLRSVSMDDVNKAVSTALWT